MSPEPRTPDGPKPPRRTRNAVLRRRLAAVGGIAALATIAAVALVWMFGRSGDGNDGPPRAAIVDQLAITDPNPGFIERATSLLERAGYSVEYFSDEQVTVDFYRTLPERDYEFILLRSHSTMTRTRRDPNTDAPIKFPSVGLFTTERYSEDVYVPEQRDFRFSTGTYPERDVEGRFFVIEPEFVDKSMEGTFSDTTVVLMGCGGLNSDGMAKAFIDRGAKSFLSWDDPVTAHHTDHATEHLLEHLLLEHASPGLAVKQTMSELGPDPTYGGELAFYPR